MEGIVRMAFTDGDGFTGTAIATKARLGSHTMGTSLFPLCPET